MFLAALERPVERLGIGRASLRVAVPGVVVGLVIGFVTPLERHLRRAGER
jgi:hypothetical protein